MKAIITKDIIIGNDENDLDLLNMMSVQHKINNDEIIIIPQKIVLDEKDMNWLFSEVFIDCKIEYCWLGGQGCDFAIQISDRDI